MHVRSILTQPIKNKLKNRKWYHQRFDGSPLFLYAVGEAETKKEPRKPTGTQADIRVSFYSHGKADWYLDMADINRGAKVIIALAKKDPEISTKLLAAWKNDEQALEQFFWEEFPSLKLDKLSDLQLVELWNNYYNLFTRRYTSSAIIDHFALGTDELIGKMINDNKIFSVATAPVHQSFINQAEIDLLKIAATERAQNDTEKLLKEYQKKYFWNKNNYVTAQVLTVKHFKKEIEAWRKSGKDLKEELKRIEETPAENKRKKAALFKQHNFSPLLKTLLKISEDFTWWQDERKKSTYLNIHIGSQILAEIGKRFGYQVDELKYAVAPEIPKIIKSQTPNPKQLQDRRENVAFVCTRDGYFAETGANVEKVRQLMLGSQKLDEIQDIRGLSASLGRAIGTARIVKSATEVAKVKDGDILIAVMTRPDYVAGMKKAAAIITDEGGITSHAAIVSRELGIPCIIGTKIATQIFKDGDQLEVNANHGWVRRL